MVGKLAGWNDTIVALATATGVGAIGVIRLSGEQAWQIANTLFPSKDLLQQDSHTLHVGLLKEQDHAIDEVVVSLFKGPRSYTGEDVVELSCHGSPFIQQQIIDACIRAGARLAKPGEFTQRAFLNGKMDLTQAEAVADLIASNTEASRKTALQNMRGGFSIALKQLRDQLLSFSALIELELDFSQEDVAFADRGALYRLIDEAEKKVEQLIHSFQMGNVIKNGVQVAIIGKPNAGKSTLLNTLLNENRAIVSDIAGTTRDTIEEVLNINGILFRLIDTAGIRDNTSDMIESIGVEKSLEKMQQADLIVYLFDITQETQEEVARTVTEFNTKGYKYLLVANKTDQASPEILNTFRDMDNIIFISAKLGDQIDTLREKLVETVLSGSLQSEDTVVTNARHVASLREVRKSLTDIRAGLDQEIPGDLLALDIRRCLHFLGEITGEISNEDQLDYIFSKFCIGK